MMGEKRSNNEERNEIKLTGSMLRRRALTTARSAGRISESPEGARTGDAKGGGGGGP
jgi:hypothetical protein